MLFFIFSSFNKSQYGYIAFEKAVWKRCKNQGDLSV